MKLITDWRTVYGVALLVAGLGHANTALAASACTARAVAILKQNSPTGFRSYELVHDRREFADITSDCSDEEAFLDSGIYTAVHELNHTIRGERNAYHLASNEMLPVPPAPNYFAPALLAPSLAKDPRIRADQYFKDYVNAKDEGAAHSVRDFTYLLDELNAYTNAMQTQIELARMHPVVNRDGGLPALMTFVAAYASHARDHAPAVWMDLTSTPASPTRLAVTALWAQAERTLAKGCHLAPVSENEDASYIQFLCGAARVSAISSVLGRQAQCPRDCLAGLTKANYPDREAFAEPGPRGGAGR